MTSPGRETVLAYSGGLIDRAASQRNDPGWIDATLARAGTRLIPLAGFVGVCESLEDAVRREVAEETGVPVGTVTYLASQGWPFPSGLMIGFRAAALAENVHVDGEEVIEARWFSRDELTEYAAAGGRIGREDSIDRYLLRSWLEEAS
jgi:NADH pyrophosphatase NudC (nudix superfamily)